jgi:hypothetical protein
MKYLIPNIALVIYLIFNSLTPIFSQSNSVNNCDTLVLKNGKMQFVYLNKIDDDVIYFYGCGTKDKSISSILKTDVLDVKRNKRNDLNSSSNQPYKLIEKPQKLYIEGTVDFSNIVGLGASISAGYQVNKWFGLGLSGKSTLVVLQVPALTFNSRMLDYRIDFDANKLYFHYGYVSSISQNPATNCDSFELDNSKPNSVFGVSWKHYSKRFLTFGCGLFYSQMPYKESCKNNTSIIPVVLTNTRNFYEFKISIGLSAPARFRKVAI